MSLITASKLNKFYGITPILTGVSFNINKGDKIGIVGANGAGKTTLMKILTGELAYDEGSLFIDKQASFSYLKQMDQFPSGGSVMEEMLKNKDKFNLPDGANPEKWARGILNSLSFGEDYLTKSVDILSGGERTRLALAAILLENPDILMLDEPTNHLDIGSLKWLEQYLRGYKGTLIVISHDRYFLDKIASRIFEIENHKLTTYEGNYTTYLEKKHTNYEIALRHYEKQQEEIRRQEDMIRMMKGHNTEHLVKRAQSREKRLEMIDKLDKPTLYNSKIKLNFKESLQTGNDVLFAEGLSKSFGNQQLFKDVALDIKKNDRICIVGSNGIGKTTLLKIILGQECADSGIFRLGQNVMPGYYDQQQEFLHPEKTVLDELHSMYIKYDQTELRNLLGRFLFTGDDVFKTVGQLSGGEKARLALLELMMSGANLLVMDEPTNHLDANSMEVIEDALLSFSGTLLIVSHDRYLLKKVPTAILELTSEGINTYLGNYDYYEEKSNSVESAKQYMANLGTSNIQQPKKALSGAESYQAAKAKASAEKKAAKAKTKLEEEIAQAESEVEKYEAELCKPEIFSNPTKAQEISSKLEAAKELVDTKYSEWYNL